MMKIQFVNLGKQYESFEEEMNEAIISVVKSMALVGGPYVEKFESEFGKLLGVQHCISVANGTDSLYIIMKMLGIGPGDEVITVANSWISSSETITQTGARPVFVDIEPVYGSINVTLLRDAITENTKAIMPVHLQGQMCDMDEILEIAKEYNLYVIEDCAQSHFSEYKAILAGTMGIAGSFSFYPGKNLGAYGDAGCIVTNNDELAIKCRMFARHGALEKHKHQMEGVNSRLDGLQAAVLSVKLPHILQWNAARRNVATWYNQALAGIGEISLPIEKPKTMHTYHLYMIRCNRRAELIQYLKENGVETAIHYPTALPNLPAYSYLGHKQSDFPVATDWQDKILSLPMYPELTNEEVLFIAEKIKEFYH